MDNDTYGHVNNVTYYSYFDTVVNEHLVRAGGLDIRDGAGRRLRRRDVAAASIGRCRFRRRSTPGCASRASATTSVTYEIALFRATARRPAATGRFVHVWVDRATQRPAAVPARIRAALAPLRRWST